MLHTNSLWACVITVCSDGGATYIIGEIIAKNKTTEQNSLLTNSPCFTFLCFCLCAERTQRTELDYAGFVYHVVRTSNKHKLRSLQTKLI